MSVTVPAGATVTVAGATPIVPVSNSVAIASSLPTQFIATGLKSANQTIQPAQGTPLTLLQVQFIMVYFAVCVIAAVYRTLLVTVKSCFLDTEGTSESVRV